MMIKRSDGQFHDWLSLENQSGQVTVYPVLERLTGNKPAKARGEYRDQVMDVREYLPRLAWSVLAWHDPVNVQVRVS